MDFIFQIFLVFVVLICIWFSNRVLDGKFYSLGINWIMAPQYNVTRNATLARVFPLESRCLVKVYGTGGTPEHHNFKCILAPNSITQYVFLLMWFWYSTLLIINFVNVLLIIAMMTQSYRVRAMYLIRAVGSRKVLQFKCKQFKI